MSFFKRQLTDIESAVRPRRNTQFLTPREMSDGEILHEIVSKLPPGALEHADISEHDRRAIAAGNLEHLSADTAFAIIKASREARAERGELSSIQTQEETE